MRLRLLTVAVLVGVGGGVSAQGVEGVVFVDGNGDGRRQVDEVGLAGVAVSNQHTVVVTGGDGSFRLDGPGTGVVSVSVPDGHRSVGPFWRAVGATANRLEFPLQSTGRVGSFTFIHASDPHVQPSVVSRLQRVGAIADSAHAAFVLVSGDLVRDALRVGEAEATGYYDLYVETIRRFRVPVWSAPGNHELFGIERHRSLVSPTHPLYARGMYRRFLGPDYYSFTYGGVHFVALNTVDYDDLWYYGHVDSVQVAWLQRDLAVLPPDMPVVSFNHIPFFTSGETMRGYNDEGVAPSVIRVGGRAQYRHTVSNARDVLAILWTRRYPLALGGHLHLHEKIRYGVGPQATRFELAAAVVGGWQDGPIAAASGVTVYRVVDGVVGEGEFVLVEARE